MINHNGENWYTVAELSEILDIRHTTIRAWIAKEKLPIARLMGRVLISETEYKEFMEREFKQR